MSEDFAHRPVLYDEVLDGLSIKPDGIYVDGTFGRGGHAGAILEQLGPEGRLLAIDKDPQAVAAAEARFGADPRFSIEQGSFTQLESLVQKRGWQQSERGGVDGVLLDLGVSSPQLDDPNRGFSFRHDGDLDMRMDPNAGQSAAEWLATAEEYDIRRVLREYGEEKFAKRIAYAIVNARAENPITSTRQLASLIADANPFHERHKDPATRSFQAIRIYINDELGDVKACLPQALDVLRPGGRLAVISFHARKIESLNALCVTKRGVMIFRLTCPYRSRPYRRACVVSARRFVPANKKLMPTPVHAARCCALQSGCRE